MQGEIMEDSFPDSFFEQLKTYHGLSIFSIFIM